MARTPLILLALSACAAPPPSLLGADLDGMQAMLVLLEEGGDVRGYAQPLAPGGTGLTLDLADVDRMTVLLYDAPLDALALRQGLVEFTDVGRALPAETRAFRLDLGASDPAWAPLDELPGPLAALRVAEPPSPCTEPQNFELDAGVAGFGRNIRFITPGGSRGAVVATTSGELSYLRGTELTPITTSTAIAPGAGWVQPGTNILWVSSVFRLITIDLDTGVATHIAALPDELTHMEGPTRPEDPFELFMITLRGKALWTDGTAVREVGDIFLTGPNDRVRVARWAPGHALLTTETPTVAELTPAGMERSTNPFDATCFPEAAKVTSSALLNGKLWMARSCRVSNADVQILRREGGDAPWQLAQEILVGADLFAGAPLLGGALLAGRGSHVVRILSDGSACPALTYNAANRTAHHFQYVVALDERTVALSGQPVRGDERRPPRVVVLRYPAP